MITRRSVTNEMLFKTPFAKSPHGVHSMSLDKRPLTPLAPCVRRPRGGGEGGRDTWCGENECPPLFLDARPPPTSCFSVGSPGLGSSGQSLPPRPWAEPTGSLLSAPTALPTVPLVTLCFEDLVTSSPVSLSTS